MGAFLVRNIPYLIIAVFVIFLIVFSFDVYKDNASEGERKWHIEKRPLFRVFIRRLQKQLQQEGIEVSKEFVTEVIAFCILGGVNPQKIRFKEGQFETYWEWEKTHRGVMRNCGLEDPEKVVNRILTLTHEIGEQYQFNIRREYSAIIRIKYMTHVPDIWWFSEIFEKYE